VLFYYGEVQVRADYAATRKNKGMVEVAVEGGLIV
jgi:hypothetical protein